MSEPDWEKFRVDETFDPLGVQQRKLFLFMHSFIDWRAEIKQRAKTPQKQMKKTKGKGVRA